MIKEFVIFLHIELALGCVKYVFTLLAGSLSVDCFAILERVCNEVFTSTDRAGHVLHPPSVIHSFLPCDEKVDSCRALVASVIVKVVHLDNLADTINETWIVFAVHFHNISRVAINCFNSQYLRFTAPALTPVCTAALCALCHLQFDDVVTNNFLPRCKATVFRTADRHKLIE